MLIDFAIKNFRSIKERQIFSMIPVAKVKELPSNVCSKGKYDYLKSAIVYGRNGSGKSNLLMAFRAMHYLITSSADFKIDQEIPPYESYRLDVDTISTPIELEINFYAKNGLRYNYSVIYDKFKILKESLYYYPGKKITKLFVRKSEEKIDAGEQLGNNFREIEKGLYPNQLFLSKVGTQKIDALIPAYTFLSRHLSMHVVHDTQYDDMLISTFTQIIRSSKYKYIKESIDKLLQVADIGIKGTTIKENKEEDFKFPDTIDEETKKKILKDLKYQVKTKHDLYQNGKIINEVEFNIEDESTGTKKLMAFGGVIIDAINDGDTLVVDELDKSLHPLLTKALIKLFNNEKTNPKGAQLIFASHDVSLLTNQLFRRDQIIFSDKKENGSSFYYSLADLKGVRKEISYEKYYLKGTFGSTPVINEYDLEFKIVDDE